MVWLCQGWGRLLLPPPQVHQQCLEQEQQQRLQDMVQGEQQEACCGRCVPNLAG